MHEPIRNGDIMHRALSETSKLSVNDLFGKQRKPERKRKARIVKVVGENSSSGLLLFVWELPLNDSMESTDSLRGGKFSPRKVRPTLFTTKLMKSFDTAEISYMIKEASRVIGASGKSDVVTGRVSPVRSQGGMGGVLGLCLGLGNIQACLEGRM